MSDDEYKICGIKTLDKALSFLRKGQWVYKNDRRQSTESIIYSALIDAGNEYKIRSYSSYLRWVQFFEELRDIFRGIDEHIDYLESENKELKQRLYDLQNEGGA